MGQEKINFFSAWISDSVCFAMRIGCKKEDVIVAYRVIEEYTGRRLPSGVIIADFWKQRHQKMRGYWEKLGELWLSSKRVSVRNQALSLHSELCGSFLRLLD